MLSLIRKNNTQHDKDLVEFWSKDNNIVKETESNEEKWIGI